MARKTNVQGQLCCDKSVAKCQEKIEGHLIHPFFRVYSEMSKDGWVAGRVGAFARAETGGSGAPGHSQLHGA